LTLVLFAGAFIVQYGFGVLLNLWPQDGGHYAVAAHWTAWLIALLVQLVAGIWFCRPLRKTTTSATDPLSAT